MSLEDQVAELLKRVAQLEAERNPPAPSWTPPTPQQLKEEIENGPLAERLKPYWSDVFGPHYKVGHCWNEKNVCTFCNCKRESPDAAERCPEEKTYHDRSLDFRIGRLKSDAAFEIRKLLTAGGDKSQACALGWGNSWPWKLVCEAKQVKE